MYQAEDLLHGDGENPDEILAALARDTVTRHNLMTLQDGHWLSDEVINMMAGYITSSNHAATTPGDPTYMEGIPKSFVFNSFLMTAIFPSAEEGYKYSAVRRWSKRRKLHITEYDRLVFPVNVNQSHWLVVAVDLRAQQVRNGSSLTSVAAARCRLYHSLLMLP